MLDKRNSFILEIFNLAAEALALLGWFGYFFTSELQNYLGDYSIYAVMGLSVLVLVVNFFYIRQLGIGHRIVSIVTDLFEMGAVVGAATLFYGPLSHKEIIATKTIDFNQVIESLEIAAAQPEAVSLFAFLGIQLLFLLTVNKK